VFDTIQLGFRPTSELTTPPGKFVPLGPRGTTFCVDIEGPPGAPTLVLLHGLAATGYLNWFPAFGPLSEHFRVVAMDLRGHGRGIPVRGRFRLADCADDVAALADALGIEQFVPVGYSMGGPVAQLTWRRHPDRVRGIVLAATSRNFGGTRQERWFYSTLVAGIYGLRAARFVPGPHRHPPVDHAANGIPELENEKLSTWALRELRLGSPGVMLQAMNAMGRFSSHTWVSEIDIPAAVVVTTVDRFIAPDRQLKLARALPDVTIHPCHANHAACVIGANKFVPALVEACLSVRDRMDPSPARDRLEPPG
jgi:pimeloyl-ACP methyl ester carboxylesterase